MNQTKTRTPVSEGSGSQKPISGTAFTKNFHCQSYPSLPCSSQNQLYVHNSDCGLSWAKHLLSFLLASKANSYQTRFWKAKKFQTKATKCELKCVCTPKTRRCTADRRFSQLCPQSCPYASFNGRILYGE